VGPVLSALGRVVKATLRSGTPFWRRPAGGRVEQRAPGDAADDRQQNKIEAVQFAERASNGRDRTPDL